MEGNEEEFILWTWFWRRPKQSRFTFD